MFVMFFSGLKLIFFNASLQRLILQKAFSSQQLVHMTVINLFELHHLRDFSNETDDQSFSSDEQISWIQLLGLFSEYPKCRSPCLRRIQCAHPVYSVGLLANFLEPSDT